MILQALNRLYDRLADDPGYAIAPPGYSLQKICFAVVVHPDGRLHAIEDRREASGNKPRPVQRLVPGQSKPSGSGLNPCFLWDNAFYLFGFTEEDSKKDRARKAFAAFRESHLALEREIDDRAFSAVCRFLRSWRPELAADHPELAEFATGFGVFQLTGESEYVHERERIRDWWTAHLQADDDAGEKTGLCLITGQRARIASIHEPKIKGVNRAQSSGALLVSFEPDAFTSYGKAQSYNAPVSEAAAFRYATALNGILSGPCSDKHRIRIGDATVVFWTERATITEDWLAQMLGGDISEVQDDAALARTRVFLQALRNGGGELRALGDDPATPVHVLALAPNAARLSVRFLHTGSIGDLFDRLRDHHDALRLSWCWDPADRREPPQFPPIWMLLRETARESREIPPLLGGALMRAVLEGTPYPDALASAVIRRIRADRIVNYLRAAILKAWLIRKPNRQGGIPVSLDIERSDPAYRLGRLFAVLEKTQEEAQPGINATIRDRFFSAASATPAIVFPRLLRTYQHHLAKLNPGAKVNREKLVQDIVDGLATMPSHLNLEQQAQFAIGYYHQRKALFTKSESNEGYQE
ncbi:MAG TPA: type I-C CRISPR-associated protein Cas8c/Csd1 [Sedimenticola thiotaurini]|uniref:Type I-C CRISPR-associated protein Cas8c/Csd1 n=1 Tax=Sedimenticola thiotaurini TaxID=1543721 RepID=A0A831RRL4_9GAMM|nr:type I-C CRISPR-associated protein Cas8c/Csd1 [Sedimenticola thiotaurini]